MERLGTISNYILITIAYVGGLFIIIPLSIFILLYRWYKWVDIEIKAIHNVINKL